MSSVPTTNSAGQNTGLIILISCVATIGGLLFGYDSGAVNGTQPGLKSAFALDDAGLGFTVGSLLIGCFIGAFFAGTLADRMGRRNVMRLAAILFLVGALIQGFAHSQGIFVLARILGGMAVGAASVLSPAYISEVVPASIRGRMTTAQQIMIITGLTLAFLVNYYLAAAAGSSTAAFWGGIEAWRWMYLMQAVPAAVFLVTLFFIPESPRYLVAKGRLEEASGVLTRLLGPVEAATKLDEIKASFSTDHRPRLSDVLTPKGGRGFLGIRAIVWAGLLLAVFQQLVGINVIFYYGATLWQLAGFTESDALLINIGSGAVSIAACFVTIALIDRIGRKPLLLIGSVGMFVTLGVLAWCFSRAVMIDGALHLDDQTGQTALIAANAYVVFFNFSWGPVMWVMLGEMFPNQMRGSALAVAGFAQWIANFAIAVSFPWMAASLGLVVTYGFYSVSALISFFLVQAWVKETRGRELEDMG